MSRLSRAEDLDGVAIRTLLMLSATRESKTSLFPRLCSITLTSLSGIPNIDLFLSQSLKDVIIRFPSWFNTYFEQLHLKSPHITSLHISGRICDTTLRHLRHFTRLETLSISFPLQAPPTSVCIDVQDPWRLELPPSITFLSFNLPRHRHGHEIPVSSLPLLKGLYIHGLLASIMPILSTTKHLEDVVLDASDAIASVSDVIACFNCLVASSSKSLRTLKFVCNRTPNLSECVSPLLSIETIQHFTIRFRQDSILLFEDVDIRRIAQAWPFLTHLVLPVPNTFQSSLTFRSLITLSTLENLQKVRIPVCDGVAQIPLDPFAHGNKVIDDRLKELFRPSVLRL